jgi:ribonuclease MRP protein subunit RMP1
MENVKLRHEYSLLRILHHRNKNQHHVAKWWRDLNTLKRLLTKLISMKDLQSKQCYDLVYKLKKYTIPQCYRSFNNIVALGQFITLGLVLLGLLARINSCIDELGVELKVKVQKQMIQRNEVVINDLGDDLGEAVENVESAPLAKSSMKSMNSEPIKTKKEKRRKDSTEHTKKKKKKRSAIDDIFG